MANRVLALGLTMALAATVACGDDSGDKPKPVDGGTAGGDGGPGVGSDGGPLTGLLDGGPGPGSDGGPGPGPGADGGPGPGADGGPGPTPGTGSGQITTAGGTVKSVDGRLSVTFSRYALTRPTTIAIAVASSAPPGATGTVYNITPTQEPFAQNQQNVSVTVTLSYSASDLGGGSPQNLKIGQYLDGKWVELNETGFGATPTKVDPTKMTITARIHSLAPVGLIGGLCVDCAPTTCTSLTDTCNYTTNGTDSVPGKCVAVAPGTTCFTCRPTCDNDNDGYCTPNDCDDGDPTKNPGAVELCNGIDDNCNFHTDEECRTCKVDADCKNSFETCTAGVCTVCNSGCTGACTTGNPAVPGTCHTFGVNNTCSSCFENCDKDFDGQCPNGADVNSQDCNDADPTVRRGISEVCGNNVDDNCDGFIDENCNTCTTDADCPRDGLVCRGGACQGCTAACDATACGATGGHCKAYGKGCSRCIAQCDNDEDGYCSGNGDTAAIDPAVNQDQPEVCSNNVDDNANGHTDEGCKACTTDTDCPLFQEYCNENKACDVCPGQCDPATCRWPQFAPTGEGSVAGSCVSFGKGCGRCGPPAASDADADGFPTQKAIDDAAALKPPVKLGVADCDDTVATTNPEAPELCGNMKDDNCNGKVDELCVTCSTSMMCGMPTICNNSR
jgi:hypothetical protein